ncbi:uncharacterized protein LOC106638548 [Copidosoma floridanum]|uniref:uncharacterized protein LOC106638548 n=1 Tax=Copidosoma floridanum TaxID=29053 RepID=UPI0006C93E11|nr:uncharacterized protein LOC106638548 [Copidosoma floridanum]
MEDVEDKENKIEIVYKNESKFLFITDRKLAKSILQEYYPKGGMLTSKVVGETLMLVCDEAFIYLKPNINKYEYNLKEDDMRITAVKNPIKEPSGRFLEILEKIGGSVKDCDNKPTTKHKRS